MAQSEGLLGVMESGGPRGWETGDGWRSGFTVRLWVIGWDKIMIWRCWIKPSALQVLVMGERAHPVKKGEKGFLDESILQADWTHHGRTLIPGWRGMGASLSIPWERGHRH